MSYVLKQASFVLLVLALMTLQYAYHSSEYHRVNDLLMLRLEEIERIKEAHEQGRDVPQQQERQTSATEQEQDGQQQTEQQEQEEEEGKSNKIPWTQKLRILQRQQEEQKVAAKEQYRAKVVQEQPRKQGKNKNKTQNNAAGDRGKDDEALTPQSRPPHMELKTGPAPTGWAISCFLAHRGDPQRNVRMVDLDLMVRWIATLHVTQTSMGSIFLYDVPGTQKLLPQLQTPLLRVTQVKQELMDEWKGLSTNDVRFVVYLDALRAVPQQQRPEYITVTDLFDSAFQRNPFVWMKYNYPDVDLFVTSTGNQMLRKNNWSRRIFYKCWRTNSHPTNRELRTYQVTKNSVLNARTKCPGMWGGKTQAAMKLMECMLETLQWMNGNYKKMAQARNCNCPAYMFCLVLMRKQGMKILGGGVDEYEPFSNTMFGESSVSSDYAVVHRNGKDEQKDNSTKAFIPIVLARLQTCQRKPIPDTMSDLLPWLHKAGYRQYAKPNCAIPQG